MAPLKIIGFLPRQVGSVIILPEEITATAGSDFDVDKMYVMFHTLKFMKNYNVKGAWDDFYKDPDNIDITSEIEQNYGEALDRFIKEQTEDWDELPDEDDLEDFEQEFNEWLKKNGVKKYNFSKEAQKRFTKWFKTRKSHYLLGDSIEVVNFKFDDSVSADDKMGIYNMAKAQTKEQRDSLIIDLMWSVLTNSDTVGKFINPGGFEEPKRVARIVSILNSVGFNEFKERFNSIEDFLNTPLDSTDDIEGLDDIASEYKSSLNPITPDTWVTLHQRNMSGASLIGIAANHNASHALMQRTNLGVSSDYTLKFNGFTYSSLHDIKNAEGKFITRNVSGFLAAFVDNAKDPVAGDMNFNIRTADIAFALLRLGIPTVTVGLIISQPIVKDVVSLVNNEYISMQEAINKVLNDYKNKASGENVNTVPSQKGINNYNFTNEELASNILASHNPSISSGNIEEATYYSNQVKVGYMFSKLNKIATALGDLTQATRSDTQNGAAGPSIADDIIKIERVEDLLDNSSKPDYPLTGIDFISFGMSEEDVINSKLPILQGFFSWGIESTENLFGKLFPQYSASYQWIIKKLKSETKFNRLSVKTRNSIYNDIISYYITQFSDFNNNFSVTDSDGKTIEVSARDYYINYFPKEFKEFTEAHKELKQLSFINRLKVVSKTKYNPAPSIIFTNVGKVTNIQKEQYIREWTNMLYMNDQIREIARKLFIYNCFKGFGFSPSGFSHLASTIIKMDNEQFIKGLRNVGKQLFDAENFWRQYILNHLNNRELVPDVSKSSVEISSDTNEFSIELTYNSSYEDKQFAHPFNEGDPIVYHNYVHFNIKGRDVYFQYNEKTNTYQKIKPLGLKNQYVEYDYGKSAETMVSVIPEAESNEWSFNEIYDDGNDIDYSAQPDNYAPLPPSTEEISKVVIGRKDFVKSVLSKFESVEPDNTDSYSGDKFCNSGISISL